MHVGGGIEWRIYCFVRSFLFVSTLMEANAAAAASKRNKDDWRKELRLSSGKSESYFRCTSFPLIRNFAQRHWCRSMPWKVLGSLFASESMRIERNCIGMNWNDAMVKATTLIKINLFWSLKTNISQLAQCRGNCWRFILLFLKWILWINETSWTLGISLGIVTHVADLVVKQSNLLCWLVMLGNSSFAVSARSIG